MCIIWETKFLCGCIIDEWWFACTNLRHDISNTGLRFLARSHVNCKAREIQRWRECLLLCELCLGKLHARVRKDADIRKTLASKETFPLAEQLGMLIVLENDALVQRGIFGKGKWRRMNMEIDKLEGLVTDVEKRVGYRPVKMRNGRNAWKYGSFEEKQKALEKMLQEAEEKWQALKPQGPEAKR